MTIGSILSIATNGLLQNARTVHETADRIVRQPITDATGETSDTDLARSIVDLKVAETGFRANASIVRTADEMSGTLLDILA